MKRYLSFTSKYFNIEMNAFHMRRVVLFSIKVKYLEQIGATNKLVIITGYKFNDYNIIFIINIKINSIVFNFFQNLFLLE